MKLPLLCSVLLTLSACSTFPDAGPLVEAHYTARLAPSLQYRPGTTTSIEAPRGSSEGPVGLQWVVHTYSVTPPQGGREERQDTLVVEPHGHVLFYSAGAPLRSDML